MDNLPDFEGPHWGTTIIPPRNPGKTLASQGYLIPYIEVRLHQGTEDDWSIILDKRFSYGPFTELEIKKLAPLLANAMAIAAGYACHGSDRRLNPYNVMAMPIGSVESIDL